MKSSHGKQETGSKTLFDFFKDQERRISDPVRENLQWTPASTRRTDGSSFFASPPRKRSSSDSTATDENRSSDAHSYVDAIFANKKKKDADPEKRRPLQAISSNLPSSAGRSEKPSSSSLTTPMKPSSLSAPQSAIDSNENTSPSGQNKTASPSVEDVTWRTSPPTSLLQRNSSKKGSSTKKDIALDQIKSMAKRKDRVTSSPKGSVAAGKKTTSLLDVWMKSREQESVGLAARPGSPESPDVGLIQGLLPIGKVPVPVAATSEQIVPKLLFPKSLSDVTHSSHSSAGSKTPQSRLDRSLSEGRIGPSRISPPNKQARHGMEKQHITSLLQRIQTSLAFEHKDPRSSDADGAAASAKNSQMDCPDTSSGSSKGESQKSSTPKSSSSSQAQEPYPSTSPSEILPDKRIKIDGASESNESPVGEKQEVVVKEVLPRAVSRSSSFKEPEAIDPATNQADERDQHQSARRVSAPPLSKHASQSKSVMLAEGAQMLEQLLGDTHCSSKNTNIDGVKTSLSRKSSFQSAAAETTSTNSQNSKQSRQNHPQPPLHVQDHTISSHDVPTMPIRSHARNSQSEPSSSSNLQIAGFSVAPQPAAPEYSASPIAGNGDLPNRLSQRQPQAHSQQREQGVLAGLAVQRPIAGEEKHQFQQEQQQQQQQDQQTAVVLMSDISRTSGKGSHELEGFIPARMDGAVAIVTHAIADQVGDGCEEEGNVVSPVYMDNARRHPNLHEGEEELGLDDELDAMMNQFELHSLEEKTSTQGDNETVAAVEVVVGKVPLSSPKLSSKGKSPSSTQHASSRNVLRFEVLLVSNGIWFDVHGRTNEEKILKVRDPKSNKVVDVFLRNDWLSTNVREGDIINVVGNVSEKQERIIVDTKENFLVLLPDCLISGTVIANSFDCTRRAVLGEIIKGLDSKNAALIYGTMKHEVFQQAMVEGNFETNWLQERARQIIARHLEAIYFLGLTEHDAYREISSSFENIQNWASIYLGNVAKNKVGFSGGADSKWRDDEQMSIYRILDVEESVWSPTFGIKGNIDLSVMLHLSSSLTGEVRKRVAPLEIKTGKANNSIAHCAQTMLYCLLMQERYGVDVEQGILYYMRTNDTTCVPTERRELVCMITARNEVARYLSSRESLSPMIRNQSKCQSCFQKTACTIYHKTLEDGTSESSGVRFFEDYTQHLTEQHINFMKKWYKLLTSEENVINRCRREIWTMTSSQREKERRCFAKMRIDGDGAAPYEGGKYHYKFIRAENDHAFSLLDHQLCQGDPVVVSAEDGPIGLAIGFVFKISSDSVALALDRRLVPAPLRLDGTAEASRDRCTDEFEGVYVSQFASNKASSSNANVMASARDALYRIDKDELMTGINMLRGNLFRLFLSPENRLRELLVDLAPPHFEDHRMDAAINRVRPFLNQDQIQAITKVFEAKDYALILGMPGTGKTTSIATIIEALAFVGKKVLLTSYTHSAVDNILLKLKEKKIPFVRLGNADKFHPEIKEHMKEYEKIDSVEGYKRFYADKLVFATTCLGIGSHPIFSQTTFDYCIVDEASQITLPVCLGPLEYSKVFVLVGDHNQLPPLVRSDESKKGGLDVSLFKILATRHQHAVVSLTHQYRMNEDIMFVANKLVYHDGLKCGSAEVASAALEIPSIENIERLHPPDCLCVTSSCWLRTTLDPSRKVVFLDTELVPAPDHRNGQFVQNEVEAKLVSHVVLALNTTGVQARDIGIISPYRAQIKIMQSMIGKSDELEMLTVDRYQGRDKDCIIISLVRSNREDGVGQLLEDFRRINVAVTRAKKKLIVIGSLETIRVGQALGEFARIVEEKQWIVKLPKDAHNLHNDAVATLRPSQKPLSRASSASSSSPGDHLTSEEGHQQNGSIKRIGADLSVKLKSNPLLLNIVEELRPTSASE